MRWLLSRTQPLANVEQTMLPFLLVSAFKLEVWTTGSHLAPKAALVFD